MTANEIVEIFEIGCERIKKATLSGNHKVNNREYDKLTEVFKVFETDSILANECLSKMLLSNNVVLRIQAAAYCLALNIKTDQAISTLQKAAVDESSTIFGFNAEMTLGVWEKEGHLRIY